MAGTTALTSLGGEGGGSAAGKTALWPVCLRDEMEE
jgi:hypothetical protein